MISQKVGNMSFYIRMPSSRNEGLGQHSKYHFLPIAVAIGFLELFIDEFRDKKLRQEAK
jgi:hypothetical protein